ncbi:MAG: ATP-grasp domain-containing protein, partial [Gammaproteobacteria bacterium]|nr:ATP-grasp domain-containing protein [Gammaproteobacteria bacterium]
LRNVPIAADAIDELCRFAGEQQVDLTVIGPEAPLVAGIVDTFEAAGLPCLGPSARAAALEGSKAFTKDFLKRHGIPTAGYETFTSVEPALAYVRQGTFPTVIKADGLAAGKGVVIAENLGEAEAAIKDMLGGQAFGDAGRRIVIEEFMVGEEASFIVLADGEDVVAFATSQDHKRLLDGDLGPNTGGMGAYSPAAV